MAFDLGALLGSVVSGVTDYQVARLNPQTDSPFIPNFIEGPLGSLPAETYQTSGVNMACGTGHPKRVLGYLDTAGNFCKKKSRKRRNRLATTSDIKDLAALKSVLGGGKAFETWIATHN